MRGEIYQVQGLRNYVRRQVMADNKFACVQRGEESGFARFVRTYRMDGTLSVDAMM